MKRYKIQEAEELLRDVEAGRDIAPKSVGFLATLCAEYEMSAPANEEEANAFHQRVQSAIEDMDVKRYLDAKVGYVITLLESEHLHYEEDSKLAYSFEQIGSLMFFQIKLDEARRVELLDAFGEFLKNRRRRGEFKEAFLDLYRNDMSRIAALPVMSTIIHMMNLEHLVD